MQDNKFSITYLKQGKLIAIDAINSPGDFMRAKKMIIEDLKDGLRPQKDESSYSKLGK